MLNVKNTIFLALLVFLLVGFFYFSSSKIKNKSCYIVYDAGSSSTRLYIYEKQKTDWIEHKGLKSSSLSDAIQNKNNITTTISELISLLDTIKYDWSKNCQDISVRVYATAGMRMAEQKHPKESLALWKEIKYALIEKIGHSTAIITRTITGYEEGLYSWLSTREEKEDNDFGIVEMGGVSSQITFPCFECNLSDFVKNITLKGTSIKIYSYSFLGLGQDESINSLGFTPACTYGIGEKDKAWKEDKCSKRILIKNNQGIFDPYNYINLRQGNYVSLFPYKNRIKKWYLTGSFKYMKEDDIKRCCLKKGKCYKKETSCFRAIYLKKYLQTLEIASNSKKIDRSWTKGAILCEIEQCLPKENKYMCRWMKNGCLKETSK